MPKQLCLLCVVEFPHPPTEDCGINPDEVEAGIKEAVAGIIGRPPKDNNDLVDPESAGRKRAAQLLPKELLATMICEWALLKEAGGGVEPIKGCHGNRATDLHHGPSKNTLHNERGEDNRNLHAICSYCHNLYHARNDKYYEGTRPLDDTPWLPVGDWKPHNPNGPKMTVQEAMVEELARGRYGKNNPSSNS